MNTQTTPFDHRALHKHVHDSILDILNEKNTMSFEDVLSELESMLPILKIAQHEKATDTARGS